jgi:lipoprotein-anchoring transpeptidase ErfK/SrfK
MLIEWRKFTYNHWRFEYALLLRSFCLLSLLTIALPNFVTFEGRREQTTRQASEEKPRTDQTFSNRLETGALTAANSANSANSANFANSAGTVDALSQADYPRIDVDLSKQMLSVIDKSGKVMKVLPISSGSGKWYISEGEKRKAVTPTGRFRAYRKIAGWRKSPLGLMYYPVYIAGGVAIHGSPYVPRRPASHGCIRIPMSAAVAFFNSTPIGTLVVVHY